MMPRTTEAFEFGNERTVICSARRRDVTHGRWWEVRWKEASGEASGKGRTDLSLLSRELKRGWVDVFLYMVSEFRA